MKQWWNEIKATVNDDQLWTGFSEIKKTISYVKCEIVIKMESA